MRTQTLYTFILSTLFLFAISNAVAAPYFYTVTAKNGDSIHGLFQRFELKLNTCDVEKFYELNHLNSDSNLKIGTIYYLPILIYEYNGKSIRSTLNLTSWTQAVRIKKYNEKIRQKKLRKMTIAGSSILWVPFHELGCNPNIPVDHQQVSKVEPEEKEDKIEEVISSTPMPTPSKTDSVVVEEEPLRVEVSNIGRTFPIFGKKHEYVPLINNKLQGKVFYIVSGHGGPDSGAIGKYGKHKLYEDEYAYDISLRLVRILIQHGATAYMITRDPNDGIRSESILPNDRDEYCWNTNSMPFGQKKRLFQRSDMVNSLYAKHAKQGIKNQILVAIHIDSRTKSKKTDIFFYHYPKNDVTKKLAQHMQSEIKKQYAKHRPGRPYYGTVTGRDLHMLRETKTNSVYIELGNIRNPNDQKRFIIESNRQLIATWLFEALYQ